MIKISVPNDDHVALRAMAKALEEIAVARGAPAQSVQLTMGPVCTVPMSTEQEERLCEAVKRIKDSETRAKADGTDPISQVVRAAQTDTTSQQVESLAIPVEANGATYETDLGSDNPQAVWVADSTGTPWDERIHSASKALNADGTWRLRRKPADIVPAAWESYIEEIKADLLPRSPSCGMSAEDFVAAFPAAPKKPAEENPLRGQDGVPEPTVTPEGDDFQTDAGVVTEQQVASFPPPPPVPGSTGATDLLPPAPTATALPVTMTFPQVMAFLTERHGRITSAQVDQIIADMGLEKITDLNTQPEHTGPFIARVKSLLGE